MLRVTALLLWAGLVGAQSPPPPQALLQKALAAQQAGNYDEAIQNYNQIVVRYPDIPEIRSNLGAAWAGKGDYAKAILEYKRALRLKPDPQVQMNLALAYYKTGQLGLAIDNLQRTRERAPGNLQVLTVLADCYLRLGKNAEVIDLISPLERQDPNNAAFNYMLGTALVRANKVAEGQVVIDRILRNGDSAQARMLMGTTKYMVKDYTGATVDFEKAVQLDQNLPEVNSWYGLALLSTGDQAGARDAFERELKNDPNNFDANFRLGALLRQDDENDAALKYLSRALEIRPNDPGVRYQIASVKLANGQLDRARADLESIIKDSPNFTEAHVSLATVYYRQKRKLDGDRERAIVARLSAERQAVETKHTAAQ